MRKKVFTEHVLYLFVSAEVSAINMEQDLSIEPRSEGWYTFANALPTNLDYEFEKLPEEYTEYFEDKLREIALRKKSDFALLSSSVGDNSECIRIQNSLVNEISAELEEFLI